jgi:hypothetical protein
MHNIDLSWIIREYMLLQPRLSNLFETPTAECVMLASIGRALALSTARYMTTLLNLHLTVASHHSELSESSYSTQHMSPLNEQYVGSDGLYYFILAALVLLASLLFLDTTESHFMALLMQSLSALISGHQTGSLHLDWLILLQLFTHPKMRSHDLRLCNFISSHCMKEFTVQYI